MTKVIALPTALADPVINPVRRGRYPKNVVSQYAFAMAQTSRRLRMSGATMNAPRLPASALGLLPQGPVLATAHDEAAYIRDCIARREAAIAQAQRAGQHSQIPALVRGIAVLNSTLAAMSRAGKS